MHVVLVASGEAEDGMHVVLLCSLGATLACGATGYNGDPPPTHAKSQSSLAPNTPSVLVKVHAKLAHPGCERSLGKLTAEPCLICQAWLVVPHFFNF